MEGADIASGRYGSRPKPPQAPRSRCLAALVYAATSALRLKATYAAGLLADAFTNTPAHAAAWAPPMAAPTAKAASREILPTLAGAGASYTGVF